MPNLVNHKIIDKLFSTNPVEGNFCSFYHVDINDAEFIYKLRTTRKDSFLKPTSGGVGDQKKYLEGYLQRFNNREEIYYKLYDPKLQKFVGILRLTEIDQDNVFNWQSFVVIEDSSPNVPIDAMLMVYRMGFNYLNRQICGPWEVDKQFIKMIKIHKILDMAKIVSEKDKYYLFSVEHQNYEKNIGKFLKMGYGKLGGLL